MQLKRTMPHDCTYCGSFKINIVAISTVIGLGYLLHDDADVVWVKVVADAQEQLDILVPDATQRLNVVIDPTNQLIITGASRMHLHTTMPVATAQGNKLWQRCTIYFFLCFQKSGKV